MAEAFGVAGHVLMTARVCGPSAAPAIRRPRLNSRQGRGRGPPQLSPGRLRASAHRHPDRAEPRDGASARARADPGSARLRRSAGAERLPMTTRRIRGARKGAGWISGVRLEPEPAPAAARKSRSGYRAFKGPHSARTGFGSDFCIGKTPRDRRPVTVGCKSCRDRLLSGRRPYTIAFNIVDDVFRTVQSRCGGWGCCGIKAASTRGQNSSFAEVCPPKEARRYRGRIGSAF